jgi:acyl-[acyl carrier protein]--UDP-N-acetylglucosamine O-acyltransferase
MNKEINDLKQQIMWLQNQNAFLTNKQEALRDHFAGMAMQSLLTKASITVGSDSVAMAAYHVAHQMLKERSRGEKRDD